MRNKTLPVLRKYPVFCQKINLFCDQIIPPNLWTPLAPPPRIKVAKCLFFGSFQESHSRSDLHVRCLREKFYIAFLSHNFFGSHYTSGKVRKQLWGKKSMLNFINHRCVRVHGKLPNLTNLASVSQNKRAQKHFRCSWFTTEPVVHLRVVQLTWNFGSRPKIGIGPPYFLPF